jgi:hypothetical protein
VVGRPSWTADPLIRAHALKLPVVANSEKWCAGLLFDHAPLRNCKSRE